MSSAQVTVHRMVTTTTTSAILINVGYLRTLPGILKVIQIIIGCIAVGICGYYLKWSTSGGYDDFIAELFFLLIATTCLITTTILLVSCLFSIATASIIPKTMFETLYHIITCALYLACSLTFVIHVVNWSNKYRYEHPDYVPMVTAGALGLVNTVLYLLSSIYSVRTFRRG